MDKLSKFCPGARRSITASCIFLVAGGAATVYLWRRLQSHAANKKLLKAIDERQCRVRNQKESLRLKLETYSTERKEMQRRIVLLSAEQLLKEIEEDRLTVLQVIEAYRAEAYNADLRTNCVTEFLDEAEEYAKYLDTLDVRKPLHGLPISLKETYGIQSHDCTAGLAKELGKLCNNDAVIVTVLKNLGAVPFVRTNIVQTTCSFGSSNPVYGLTVNPHNTERTPGGSSSGEGAILGAGASLIGFGTDIGGSVRIPAHCCGIFSLKPTHNRLSGLGIKPSIPGSVGVHDCPGLMSREVQGIITVFREMVTPTMFELDSKVVPIPFQTELYNTQRPLKIGYYEGDGRILPTPGCRRAVRIAKGILEKMGHEVVPFRIPLVDKAYDLTMTFYFADGGLTVYKMIENEPAVAPEMSYATKDFFHKIKETVSGKIGMKGLDNSVVFGKSTYESWRLLIERAEYVELFNKEWKSQMLDAVIGPGYIMPACKMIDVPKLGDTIFATGFYNMLNFPVGAVPVTKETEEDQDDLESYPADTATHNRVKEATYGAVGMPLGVQVVGLPWQEERVLRVMKDIDLGLKTTCFDDEFSQSTCFSIPDDIGMETCEPESYNGSQPSRGIMEDQITEYNLQVTPKSSRGDEAISEDSTEKLKEVEIFKSYDSQTAEAGIVEGDVAKTADLEISESYNGTTANLSADHELINFSSDNANVVVNKSSIDEDDEESEEEEEY